MKDSDRRQLYKDFLEAFPLKKLSELALEEYIALKSEKTFCYWLEFKTEILGSIKGGNSSKFGIYEFAEKSPKGFLNDKFYCWSSKLGKTSEEAFGKVKDAIIRIANHASKGEWGEIEKITILWPIVTWKIAFLYSNGKLLPIYNKDKWLVPIASKLGLANAQNCSMAQLYEFLIEEKKDRDLYEFYDYLCSIKNGSEEKIDNNVNKTYSEDIKLLRNAHNLVLTGAPGTGKTYMAKEIAKAMGANENSIKMVQFHPSYDYTDFVEGLRPIKEGDSLGFQRKDGVFKAFCKEALSPSDEAIKEIYNSILERVEKGDEIKVRQQNGKYKILSEITKGNLGWFRSEDAKAKPDIVSIDTVLNVFHQFPTKEAFSKISPSDMRKQNVVGGDATMIWTIVNYLWEEINKQKTYVFIIDEINRGEISKIFGELFYSIDPGYRGEKGKVDTQYQNLIPKEGDLDFDATNPDVFRNGFFVPENVYIIGTMNDIDRSVESMDFAMRRRFTWKEIVPDETASMLDDLSCAKEANDRMKSLNKAIAEVDGLGKAYMIGPAYFLKLKDNNGNFEELWEMNLQPLLHEYLRGFRKPEEIMKTLKKAYDEGNSEQGVVDGNNAN